MTELLDRAERLARSAHAGQTDKAGRDYFTAHVADVVTRLVDALAPYDALVVGYLHDVLEDTAVTEDELREQFADAIVDAVVAISRRVGERPEDYYRRVRGNTLARIVKLSGDIPSNTDPARLALLDEATRHRLERKYAHAVAVLTEEEEER